MTNLNASLNVRTCPADILFVFPHNRNMPRRGVPKQVNWYLREWMAANGLTGRGAQSRMMERTGWSKATMSQLYKGTQDYSPKIVNEAAAALHAEPWELLMHPERAMRLRRLRADLAEIAQETIPEPVVDEFSNRRVGQTKAKPQRGTGTHG